MEKVKETIKVLDEAVVQLKLAKCQIGKNPSGWVTDYPRKQ